MPLKGESGKVQGYVGIQRDVTERRRAEEALRAVSYTHLRAHETPEHLVCRLLLENKNE